MKKIFIGLGVIILIAVAGRAYWAYQQVKIERSSLASHPAGKDIAPIDDSDLRLSKVVVLDQDNAYFDLIKIDKVIYYPEDKKQLISDMVAGKAWDQKLADELIAKNKEAFGYFADAALKPKFQDPVPADPVNISTEAPLPKLNSWRNMAVLSVVRSLSFAKQGKDKEAIEEVLRPVNVGQKIQNSQGALIEYVVAMAMKGIGLQATQKILVTSKLKTDELKKHTQDLNQYYNNKEGLVLAIKGEHQLSSAALGLVIGGLAKGESITDSESLKKYLGSSVDYNKIKANQDYYFQPNKTKLLETDFFRGLISMANTPCWDAQEFSIKKLDISTPSEIYATENAIGIILRDALTALSESPNKKCQEDALIGATQTMFALKAFKNDARKYPTTLGELVPKYLDVVPTDPFDGKQLKYSAEKKIVYSIGEDKKDDGGVMNELKKAPDIVYLIGF